MLIKKNNYQNPLKTIMVTKKVKFYEALKKDDTLYLLNNDIGILFYPVPADIPKSFLERFEDKLEEYSIFVLNDSDDKFHKLEDYDTTDKMVNKYNNLTTIIGLTGAKKIKLVSIEESTHQRNTSVNAGLDKNKNFQNEGGENSKNSKISGSYKGNFFEKSNNSIKTEESFNENTQDLKRAKELAYETNLIKDPTVRNLIEYAGLRKTKKIMVEIDNEIKKTISANLNIALLSNNKAIQTAVKVLLGTKGEFYFDFIDNIFKKDKFLFELQVEY